MLQWSERLATKTVAYGLLIAVFLIPLQATASRLIDSNFRKNYVPYQMAKDVNTILPVNSVYLAYGDNEKFQGRYLKLLGRFREDVCHMNLVTLQESADGMDGCTEFSYGSMTPDMLLTEKERLRPYLESGKLLSGIESSEDFPLQDVYSARKFSFLYTLINPAEESALPEDELFYEERLERADRLIGLHVCDDLGTDDLFTDYQCGKYRTHMDELIKLYIRKRK